MRLRRCPRNCKRRAACPIATGFAREGRQVAATRKPGDLPSQRCFDDAGRGAPGGEPVAATRQAFVNRHGTVERPCQSQPPSIHRPLARSCPGRRSLAFASVAVARRRVPLRPAWPWRKPSPPRSARAHPCDPSNASAYAHGRRRSPSRPAMATRFFLAISTRPTMPQRSLPSSKAIARRPTVSCPGVNGHPHCARRSSPVSRPQSGRRPTAANPANRPALKDMS